jgi:hypothetical protein
MLSDVMLVVDLPTSVMLSDVMLCIGILNVVMLGLLIFWWLLS